MKRKPPPPSSYDSMPVGVFTVDIDMNITDFNPVAEKITGFSQEEALQCKCYEIFRSPRCFRQCRLRAALEKGEGTGILRTQNRILRKDNIEIPIDITASVLADETGGVTGAIECFQEPFSDLIPEAQRRVERSDAVPFQNIIGNDQKILAIIEILAVAAKTDVHILITGETGTGKDVFARCVHKASPRNEGRFIKVNCAAIPGELLESEFFGYEKGAFTDAKTDKPGRFQMAEGGTIFLDEIAELPLNLQAKLLQVLDEKTFYPLGASKPVSVDVRVLSSTNRDLGQMVAEGTFRQDLYYRLNVIAVEIPPLRDRLSDIPLLIDHFLKEFFPHEGKVSSDGVITAEAQDLLLRYTYPGNVRELKHIIEHALVMSQGKPITPAMLPEVLVRVSPPQAGTDSRIRKPGMSPSDDEERAHILDALREHSWNRRKTADALSIDRTTLWRKMKRLGLLD